MSRGRIILKALAEKGTSVPQKIKIPNITSMSSQFTMMGTIDSKEDLKVMELDADIHTVPHSSDVEEPINSKDDFLVEESDADSDYIPNFSDVESDSFGSNPSPSPDIPATTDNEILINNSQKESSKRKQTEVFCFYCENTVLNFARHLKRSHANEIEVSEILSLRPKSHKRSVLIASLRKKGNFLCSSYAGPKPVYRKEKQLEDSSAFLPCPHCLGFYSRKQLWRHKKICPNNKNGGGGRCQGGAQNLIAKFNPLADTKLKELVFPKMRADNISLIVKSDPLICAFGSRYMKTHKEKHFINVTSRKMRELGRLMIKVTEMKPDVKSLFSALSPEFFDIIVMATKKAAKFDTCYDSFHAPTYAMNISRSLKECCDIAILFLLKKYGFFAVGNYKDSIENLKTMKDLLASNWRYEISTLAANDLNTKHWNKVTLIPLANDIKIFKEYLTKLGDKCAEDLKKNPTVGSYTELLETIYCRLLLLNRRRPGELQRLPAHLFTKTFESQNYEEFSKVVSETEKILLDKFKRVVIRGKRGRGVPVLFSDEVQRHTDLLISFRPKFVTNNPYLFGRPNTTLPIYGYKVFQKHAKNSGAKYPAALTATKLRKHLATISQLFNLNSNDMEQLALFMGHTIGTHHKSYRLPDDVYQTAKISKLLLLMEQGVGDKYKGKSLDEIDVDLDEDLLYANEKGQNGNSDSEDEIDFESINDAHTDEKEICTNETGKMKTSKKKILVPWTMAQKKAVMMHFRKHIQHKQPPKRLECEEIKNKYPDLLENKCWKKIKVFIQNEYSKK